MRPLLTTILLLLLWPSAGETSSLRVTPALLNVTAPASATALTLRNGGIRPLHAQIRVFRWTQTAGAERLEPTSDVVASPPMVALAEGVDYVVRVVRVTKVPISAEESYRVLIDELPNPALRRAGTVMFVLRYSVPGFFTTATASPAAVAWSAKPERGGLLVTAANSGGTRLRVANLKLIDANGAIISRRDGLVGYVLSGSVMTWWLRGSTPKPNGIKIVADSELGPVHAPIKLQLDR